MARGNIELLIIRHSQRTGSTVLVLGGDGPEIKLTEKGIADAYNLGEKLKLRFPNYSFPIPFASPKSRTMHTAQLIYQGYFGDHDKKVDVKADINLFPWMGVEYVHPIARKYSEEVGDAAFFMAMYKLKENEIALVGAPFANIVLNAINKSKKYEGNEIELFVSHDYDIISFLYYILPREQLENYMQHPLSIPVLGGFRISITDGKATFYWNEKEIKIEMSRIEELMKHYKEVEELAKKLRAEGKFDFNSNYFK